MQKYTRVCPVSLQSHIPIKHTYIYIELFPLYVCMLFIIVVVCFLFKETISIILYTLSYNLLFHLIYHGYLSVSIPVDLPNK